MRDERIRRGGAPAVDEAAVSIPVDVVELEGSLAVPEHARGVVLFAHGSGSSRRSPRNRAVAAVLNRAGIGTLLFDLLTREEAGDRARVFDIPLLAARLAEATEWVRGQPEPAASRLGYFGASTGAAAALWAAAAPGIHVDAVVSRGGRPDLAGGMLTGVTAPVLLVVGERDDAVVALNREAERHLRGPKELAIVPGAGHLFEEPGAMEAVARLARAWFTRYLVGS
jgi:putative phosphoribosyl transferase